MNLLLVIYVLYLIEVELNHMSILKWVSQVGGATMPGKLQVQPDKVLDQSEISLRIL
jgi:hypothetical protein